jgi:DNA-binding IclR family transcriptional regulator
LFFVSVDDLARIFAISTRSAGRILSKMCELGLAIKLSKNTYRLVVF